MRTVSKSIWQSITRTPFVEQLNVTRQGCTQGLYRDMAEFLPKDWKSSESVSIALSGCEAWCMRDCSREVGGACDGCPMSAGGCMTSTSAPVAGPPPLASSAPVGLPPLTSSAPAGPPSLVSPAPAMTCRTNVNGLHGSKAKTSRWEWESLLKHLTCFTSVNIATHLHCHKAHVLAESSIHLSHLLLLACCSPLQLTPLRWPPLLRRRRR